MAHHNLHGRKRPHKQSRSKISGKITATAKKEKRKARREGNDDQKKKKAPPGVATLTEVPIVPAKNAKKRKMEARVQANLEKQHQAMYSSNEPILLVGEGNFSFARALCRNMQEGKNVFATAFDNEATINTKYPDAAECREEIEEKFGGTTFVGVDARKLHKVREFHHMFHKIVWNFPHIGSGETDVEKNVADHRKLLADFFTSAVKCLDPEQRNAAIHVALKDGEPYKSWKLPLIVQAACPELQLRATAPFVASAWPGYAHRRTAGFDERFSKADNEELSNGSKVYIFLRRRS